MEADVRRLLDEDTAAIKDLTSITQLQYLEAFQNISVLDISPAEKTELFKKASAEIAHPGFKINETLSAKFYSENRELDLGEGFDFDPSSEAGFSQETFSAYMAQSSWGMNQDQGKSWQDTAAQDALILLLGGSLTKAFLASRADHYGKIGSRDRRYKRRRRIPNPKACAYCMRACLSGGTGPERGFHRYCRCMVGIEFDKSPSGKYRNPSLARFEEDHAKAVAALERQGKPTTESTILSTLRDAYGYR